MRAARRADARRCTRLLTMSVLLQLAPRAAGGGGRSSGFFQQMVGGDAADVRTFFSQHFERLPMLKRFSDRSPDSQSAWTHSYGNLISLADVDGILRRNATAIRISERRTPLQYGLGQDLFLGRSTVMEDGERWTEIPPLNNLAEDKSTLLEGVVAAGMRHGFSLILNKVNYRHAPVSAACEDVERFFGQHCQANVYVTPAIQREEPNQGFEIHWDEMESYVVQLSGSKHWYVYHSPVRLPAPHQRIKPRVDEAGAPSMEFTLQAGDVLYLPRGWIHDARTFSTDSLHVTVGVQGEKGTWASLLHAAIDVAASDKQLKLTQRAGKRDAPTYVELLHVLVSSLENSTAEVRQMAPLAPRLLAALRTQTPGYDVEFRFGNAVALLKQAAEAPDLVPQLVRYALQPREPKRHVGTADYFLTEHPLVVSWCQQLADPAAADHAAQLQSRVLKAAMKVVALASTPAGFEQTVRHMEAFISGKLTHFGQLRDLALKHHGQDAPLWELSDNEEELRRRRSYARRLRY